MCQVSLIILFQVGAMILESWEVELEQAQSFGIQMSKITLCRENYEFIYHDLRKKYFNMKCKIAISIFSSFF